MTETQLAATVEHGSPTPRDSRPIALIDLLDRLLGTGVVLSGDVLISLAGVDLVEVRLRALIRSVRGDEDGDEDGGEDGDADRDEEPS